MIRPAERIVSLLPSATEIVCALGLSDKLLGVTHECDFPVGIDQRPHLTSSKIHHGDMTSIEVDHAVRSQLDGHGSIYELDEKLLERLAPDLILTQELCDVCAVNYRTVMKASKMISSDATVLSLEPEKIEDIFSNIMTVGEITGSVREAGELVDRLRKRLESISRNTAGLDKRPRVLMLEWLEPPFAPGHWVPEQVAAGGGICVLGSAGERSVSTTFRALSESQADVMVFIPCGYGIADIFSQLENTAFPAELADLPAIAEERIWAADASAYFSRPGPRVVEGAEILARILHPGIFGEPSPTQAVRVSAESLKFTGAKSAYE